MRLLLRIERRTSSEGTDSLLQTLEGDTIVIGRGAAATIRLASESVAPAHAVLEQSGEGLLIHDLGGLTRTHVNGEPVQTASLQAGDRIKIGPHELTVFREGPLWGVQMTVHEGEGGEDDPQRTVNQQLQRLDVEKQLPSFLALSLFILAALGAIYLLYPLTSGQQANWSSGPLAKVHRHLEGDCAACHSQPFAPVQDKDCLACHSVKDHTGEFKGEAHHFAIGSKRCAECHHDHSGDKGVLPHDARLCSDCHARIKTIKPDTQILDVPSWDEHPEFRLKVSAPGETLRKLKPGSEGAPDRTALKLNHAVHLKENIRGPNGRVTMSCTDCHAVSGESQAPAPISFEKNCQSCHLLEFDERFPGQQVPHGDTHRVSEFLFSRYSLLFLGPDQSLKPLSLNREKPGPAPTSEQYNRATLDLINGEVIKTETLLYTRTACQLCHQIEEKKECTVAVDRFQIAVPAIPTRWFSQARFSHKPHLSVACVSCHKGAGESTQSADVLLPDVESCRSCHSQKPLENRIQSDCTECHGYHAETALHVPTNMQSAHR